MISIKLIQKHAIDSQEITELQFPAVVFGWTRDDDWGGRECKAITCTMSFDDARKIFVDGLSWSILYTPDDGEDGIAEEYDNSEFTIAGPLTDNRDGTITAKMGKYTNEELLLMEVLG